MLLMGAGFDAAASGAALREAFAGDGAPRAPATGLSALVGVSDRGA